MTDLAPISGRAPADPATDWSALVEEGRATLAAMGDGRWTDFNAHDPGITMLEAFAYALTDLGYRCGHSIDDLMAGAPAPATAADVLTTRAVTPSDLRRIGLDVPGVRNIWLEPATGPVLRLRHALGSGDLRLDGTGAEGALVTVSGVHRVLIEKDGREDLGSADVIRAVAARLHRERNLGEDFETFSVLESEPVVVVADLAVADPAAADSILLAALSATAGWASPEPPPPAATPAGEAPEGPRLSAGGVADPGPGRPEALYLSDLIAALAAIPGVRGLSRVRIGRGLADAEGAAIAWSLPVGADRVPRLDLAASRIRLFVGTAEVADLATRPAVVERHLDARRGNRTRAPEGAAPSRGRDRDLAHYRPLRLDLPAVYGVGADGLDRDAPPARRAEARQLRAWLALLDGLLASGFARLAGARTVLAPGAQPAPRPVSTLADSDTDLLGEGDTAAAVAALAGTAVSGPEERLRMLDHLLARGAETVPAAGIAASPDARADTGTRFLADFSGLSAGRGTGADLLADGAESPLVERLGLKLGLIGPPRLLLVEHVLLRATADDAIAAEPLLAAAARADPYSHQLSIVLDAALAATPEQRTRIGAVIRAEAPAHLVCYLHWLEPEAFTAFAEAHARWMAALGRHRRAELGLA